MATSDFSLTKILCIFGAGIMFVFGFFNIGIASGFIPAGKTFCTVVNILSAIGLLVGAIGLYKYYDLWDKRQKQL